MLDLPAHDHPVRELFDVRELAEMCSPENRSKLPTYRQAQANAVKFLAGCPTARSVNSVCLRANDSVQLVTFGPKGGARVRWNFGRVSS